jgi:putative spermidine/putrescine transport system substrate-binding protein
MPKTSQFPIIDPPVSPIARRSVLLGLAATLAQFAVGCNRQNRNALILEVLEKSIPAALWAKFRQEKVQQSVAQLSTQEQLPDLFALLQKWHDRAKTGSRKGSSPDLVMLGDYWLAKAIEWELIKPINPTGLWEWEKLSAKPIAWQTLVQRDRQGKLDPKGEIWALPYRWGTTAIAYRTDKLEELGWTPKDWSDLWNPQLQGRISLPDSPREVIGLTLKKLGHSYNTPDPSQISHLESELATLHRQVKLYSSDAYLQPLILKDTWVAVGSSTDILNLMQYNRDITAVIPASGTSLWAELWVRPASSPAVSDQTRPLWVEWVDFCWTSGNASQLSILSRAASPILTGLSLSQLPDAVQANPILLPDSPILENSEFLNPLPNQAIEQYRQIWTKMRNG